jgi:membrane protein DedA with SNARE-associated domain
MNASHLVSSYGYYAVGLLILLECVGVPLPGEAILIAAGTYAGQSHKLSIWLIFVIASFSAIVGFGISFWIGVKGGYPLLRKYGRYIHINEGEMKVGRYIFDRYGGGVVFFGRFVAVLRTYAAFLAGTNRMSWRKFLIFNGAGGVAWAALWSFLSYSVGSTLKKASAVIDYAIGGAAVVLVVAAILFVRHHSKRIMAKAEEAYPGPLMA